MDKDISARASISGIVNGAAMIGTVLGAFNTGTGGRAAADFTQLPSDFTPATLGTHACTSCHCPAAIRRDGDNALNLYDLTNGNYRILRTITCPDYSESQILLDARVEAVTQSQWVTTIWIHGLYTGPSDIVSAKDYTMKWFLFDDRLFESGTVLLVTSSGQSVRQVWYSIIAREEGPERLMISADRFPPAGESVSILFSAFQIDGHRMSYEFEGAVRSQGQTQT